VGLGEDQTREAILNVFFEVLGDPRLAHAPSDRQLGGEPQGCLPARCREHTAQTFGEILAPGAAHHSEKIPRVVDLAPLVGGALEVTGYRAAFSPPWSFDITSSTPERPRRFKDRKSSW